MKSVLFMVFLAVLSVSLYAAPVSPEPTKDFETILFSSQEEVIGTDLYMTVSGEIVAIKPDEIVLNLPEGNNILRNQKSDAVSKSSYMTGINKRGISRIKSGRH